MTSGKDHRMCGLHRPRAAGQRPRGGRRAGSLLSGPLWAWRRGRHSGRECRLHGHMPPSASPLCICAGHPGASHEPSKNTDPTLVTQVSPNAVLLLVFLQPLKNVRTHTGGQASGLDPPLLSQRVNSLPSATNRQLEQDTTTDTLGGGAVQGGRCRVNQGTRAWTLRSWGVLLCCGDAKHTWAGRRTSAPTQDHGF